MEIPEEVVRAGCEAADDHNIYAPWHVVHDIIKAAAPFLQGDAWDHGYNDARDEHRDTGGFGDTQNPYRTEEA